ncbi:hypothetical protein D6833_01680, partial [Candidatus Parcubacteria bacterium]
MSNFTRKNKFGKKLDRRDYMNRQGALTTALCLAVALLLAGCGQQKAKTAACKDAAQAATDTTAYDGAGTEATGVGNGLASRAYIDGSPALLANSDTAQFSFGGGDDGVTFECRLDGGEWSSCTSPVTLTNLSDGAHTFEIRTVDAAGNASTETVQYSWTVDTTPPVVTFQSGPANGMATDVTLTFSCNETGCVTECSLDGGVYATCTSPVMYNVPATGEHTLSVRGADPAGNGSAVTSWTWATVGTVAAGGGYSCYLEPNHTLWCWGDNQYGQLGNGSYNMSSPLPVTVVGPSTWVGVAVAPRDPIQIIQNPTRTYGLRMDGSIWVWGSDPNASISSNVPVQYGSVTDWTDISIGEEHSCGLQNNGTLWCWGTNTFGQLGDGTTTYRTSPTQVQGTGWVQVSAGFNHTCGVKSAGTLWCWGNNFAGQLGDGTTTQRLSPTQVTGTGWVQVSAGFSHTCGVKSAGTLWCWGYNYYYGQLGDGTTTLSLSPTQATGTGWV